MSKKGSKQTKEHIEKRRQSMQSFYASLIGKKYTEEHKRKISLSLIGKPKSLEHNKKVSEALKSFYQIHKRKGQPCSDETKRKIGLANSIILKGRNINGDKLVEWNKKNGNYWKGKRMSEEIRKKQSHSHVGIQAKEKHPQWKGGITPINQVIRHSEKYTDWIKAIFQRDDYICKWCKQRGGKLNADHIKPFAYFPGLRFELSNGQTLCENCHSWKTKWDLKIWKGKVPELNILYAT